MLHTIVPHAASCQSIVNEQLIQENIQNGAQQMIKHVVIL